MISPVVGKLNAFHIFEGLQEGLSLFSGASRVAIIYVVRPEDGNIVHSLGGDPPVPDLLRVDPNCAVFVAEDSGHMAMFGLSSCLRVVS